MIQRRHTVLSRPGDPVFACRILPRRRLQRRGELFRLESVGLLRVVEAGFRAMLIDDQPYREGEMTAETQRKFIRRRCCSRISRADEPACQRRPRRLGSPAAKQRGSTHPNDPLYLTTPWQASPRGAHLGEDDLLGPPTWRHDSAD